MMSCRRNLILKLSNSSIIRAYLDLGVDGTLLIIELVIIVRVHLQVVEGEFFLDALFERQALIKSEGIGLGNNWNDIDDIGQLLEDNNIDGLKAVGIRKISLFGAERREK